MPYMDCSISLNPCNKRTNNGDKLTEREDEYDSLGDGHRRQERRRERWQQKEKEKRRRKKTEALCTDEMGKREEKVFKF